MTVFSTTRPQAGVHHAGGHLLSGLISRFNAWNEARVTRNALSRLSDRELDDIGLCRADIDALTR